MKPAPFRYERATTLQEATERLAELGDEAKLLAGGQSLVPMMNLRLAQPEAVLDINPIAELSFIEQTDDSLLIGATVTQAWPE